MILPLALQSGVPGQKSCEQSSPKKPDSHIHTDWLLRLSQCPRFEQSGSPKT